jgi:cytochrome P450
LRIHIRTLLMAGNETTTSLISNMVYRLVTVPGAQERLRADRSLIEPFIEECLRYDAPLTQFPRRCKAEASIAGVTIEVDEVVSVSMPSANRDESAWGDNAEEFVVDRFVGEHPEHLSFGLGVHLCIGAPLARKTATITLEALLDQTEDLALAPGYRFEKVWFFQFWRPQRLDVTLVPRLPSPNN